MSTRGTKSSETPLLSSSTQEEEEKNSKMDFESEWERKKTWLCFFVLGCLNNFAYVVFEPSNVTKYFTRASRSNTSNHRYVVIISGAKSLATNDFENSKKLIGVINWALVGLGLAARALNMFMETWSARLRTAITATVNFVGIAILTISPHTGSFWIAIGSIVMIGSACSFGESVILGYLKVFPQRYTGAWSSGTGLAGVAGSL